MADLTRLVTPDILRAFDFSQISHLMDVGGGSGELIGAIARQYPGIRGTVFDLPRCELAAKEYLQQLGVSDRALFVPGNFFETIPSIADAIILKSVIHDWNDERSSRILRNCHRALPKDGTLLLVERIILETPTASDVDKAHVMSDLNMLRGPGGLERSECQYRLLLEESGLRQTSLVSAGRFSMIEARAN
jgi:cyclopropane fatty-acyl-phospholipid synthase-like methyltransferase